MADLGRNGQDADASGNRVSTLSAPRRRKRRNEAGTEASLNNPPAVRRRTALLRGRQLRLPWRTASGSRQPSGAQCRRRERECGELPPPLWSRLVERLAGTFAFLGRVLAGGDAGRGAGCVSEFGGLTVAVAPWARHRCRTESPISLSAPSERNPPDDAAPMGLMPTRNFLATRMPPRMGLKRRVERDGWAPSSFLPSKLNPACRQDAGPPKTPPRRTPIRGNQ